jgi:hypothetical protein
VAAIFEAFSARMSKRHKARLNGKDVRLVSRNKKAFDYPQLVSALKLLPADRVILDGEIAALDERGRSSFQLLQMFKSSEDVPLVGLPGIGLMFSLAKSGRSTATGPSMSPTITSGLPLVRSRSAVSGPSQLASYRGPC